MRYFVSTGIYITFSYINHISVQQIKQGKGGTCAYFLYFLFLPLPSVKPDLPTYKIIMKVLHVIKGLMITFSAYFLHCFMRNCCTQK